MHKPSVWHARSSSGQRLRRFAVSRLFNPGTIINVGLSSFAEAVVQTGGRADQVEWTPPAAGDREVGLSLARLVNHPTVEAATRESFDRYSQSQPVLVGVGIARQQIPGMEGRMLLHAGPPIAWHDMLLDTCSSAPFTMNSSAAT